MKDLAQPQSAALAPTIDTISFADLLDAQKMNALQHVSAMFAKSKLIPEHFRGKPEDIFVALHMAMWLRVDPITMMQSTYVINGRPGMSATLVMSLAQRSGVFAGPITYTEQGSGKTLAITAHGTIRETGEPVKETIPFSLAEAEGWTRNTKYKTMPAHMLRYRAATWLIRRYAPHVTLGMSTADELKDIGASAEKPTRAQATTSGPNLEDMKSPKVVNMAFTYTKAAEALNWKETEIIDEVEKAIAAKHNGEIPANVTELSEPLAIIARARLREIYREFNPPKVDDPEPTGYAPVTAHGEEAAESKKRRKQINLLIGQQKLDREAVKVGLGKLFGIPSTSGLDALAENEWNSVIADLNLVIAAGKEDWKETEIIDEVDKDGETDGK